MLEDLIVEEKTIFSLKVVNGYEFSEVATIVEMSLSAT